MKRLLITNLVFLFLLTNAFAQGADVYTELFAKIDKRPLNKPMSNSYLIEPLDSLLRFRNPISPIDIPTAKPLYYYQLLTPTKILTGKGLSPMPGTEKLDAMNPKLDSLMQKNKIIKIKTFPTKEEIKKKDLSISAKQTDKKKKAST